MKYQVVRNCVIAGQSHQAGSVVEVSVDDATVLMGMGRIMPHDESKAENRSIGLEESEKKPKSRRSIKKAD